MEKLLHHIGPPNELPFRWIELTVTEAFSSLLAREAKRAKRSFSDLLYSGIAALKRKEKVPSTWVYLRKEAYQFEGDEGIESILLAFDYPEYMEVMARVERIGVKKATGIVVEALVKTFTSRGKAEFRRLP